MHPAIVFVLDRLRSALGTGETPANSNNNFIVAWYNDTVERIGRGPWCQMTVTWSHFTSLPKRVIKGRAYTVWAAQDFQAGHEGGTWHWGTAGMQAGDIVYYDWDLPRTGVRSTDRVDHVGTVERVIGNGTFYVLEGNNNANRLDRMIRDSKFVVGYGRPDWSRSGVPIPAVASPIPNLGNGAAPKALVVNGVRDKATYRLLQAYLNYALKAGLNVDGDFGPKTKRALEKWLGDSANESLSTAGVRTLQRKVGSTPDGDWGPKTTRALQMWLNNHRTLLRY